MKKWGFTLLMLLLCACGKELSFKGKEYIYQDSNGFQILLGFDKDTNKYYGKGINKFFGLYYLKDKNLSFQQPSSTMNMGDSRHMSAEETFLNILCDIQAFELSEKQLTLITRKNEHIFLTLIQHTYPRGTNYEK